MSITEAALTQSPWQKAARQYKRDGYYIARGIVPEPQVAQVFSDMHRLVANQLKEHRLPYDDESTIDAMHQDLQTLFSFDLKAYLATLTLCAKLVSLYELYMSANIRAFAAEIGITFPVFQTAPVMHLMSRKLKVPEGYFGYGVHQDWPTLQGGLDTVTVWIPLVDVDRHLFTMEIIPGSQMGGLYPHTRESNYFAIDPNCYDEQDFVPMEGERGDVVFMSSFSIHRSSLNGDDRLRVSTSMRYENADEPNFVARSYPFAQKRSVINELITPDFPSVEQVRKVFA